MTTPLGHTSFSWQPTTTTPPPLGHTAFSWGPPASSSLSSTTSLTTNLTTITTKPITLVDADCNFLHEDLYPQIQHHLKQASCATPFPVTQFITPCVCMRDLPKALSLRQEYPSTIFVTAGVHPFWSTAKVNGTVREGGHDCTTEAIAQLRAMAMMETFRCIGECGLDLIRPPNDPKGHGFPTLQDQLPWFEVQVKIAIELSKNLFLHERKAHYEFLSVLDPYLHLKVEKDGRVTPGVNRSLPPCLVHAFTGTSDELDAYCQRDFYIGITGFILEKKASTHLRKCLPLLVPLHRLLVETDAPYMGFKGCRSNEKKEMVMNDGRVFKNRAKDKYPNVPAALPKVIEVLAGLYNVSLEVMAMTTTNNAEIFFNMKRETELKSEVEVEKSEVEKSEVESGVEGVEGVERVEGVGEEKRSVADGGGVLFKSSSSSSSSSSEQEEEEEENLKMATNLEDQGEYEEAIILLKKLLIKRENRLGQENPETLTIVWKIGIALQDQNKLNEAEPMLLRALEGYEHVLGHNHQDTLVAAYGVADFYETKKKFLIAEKYSKWSLNGYIQIKSIEDVVDGVEQLCALLEQQGKHEEADALEAKFA